MMKPLSFAFAALLGCLVMSGCSRSTGQATVYKHSSGRLLGEMPKITEPVMFYTPQADRILEAMQVFPANNPWNEDVSEWPLHPNSRNIIASIGADKPFRYSPDMGFVLVPPNQKKIDIPLVLYPDEADPGPYPIPDNTPIEGWPNYFKQFNEPLPSLAGIQADKAKAGGDRHGIVVDPVNGMLYEFYQLIKTPNGWQAAHAAVFDLKSNKLRPEGWTSSDAAGLPIFPAVVRHDDIKRGMVDHAMRVTAARTRRAYIHPARHFASEHTDMNLPRMGERFRLRKDFDISGFSPAAQAILKGLQKHGMMVADNGLDWMISIAPDERIPNIHVELRRIRGADFEVVRRPGDNSR